MNEQNRVVFLINESRMTKAFPNLYSYSVPTSSTIVFKRPRGAFSGINLNRLILSCQFLHFHVCCTRRQEEQLLKKRTNHASVTTSNYLQASDTKRTFAFADSINQIEFRMEQTMSTMKYFCQYSPRVFELYSLVL